MLRNIFIFVVISVLAIFLQHELAVVVHFTLRVYAKVTALLGMVFSVDAAGATIESIITLLALPAIFGGIVAGIYYLVRKKSYKHTLLLIWLVWAILITALLAKTGVISHEAFGVSQTLHSLGHAASHVAT